jgi:tellurite resistance protein TerC
MQMDSVGSLGFWIGFFALILGLLALDLGLVHRHAREVSIRQAAVMTVVWMLLAGGFAAFVHEQFGATAAIQFASGYIVEQALSVDNVFVFSVVLGYFAVPKELQHRVLFWGVLGALLLRGVFIGVGAALIQNFHFVVYVFGLILVYTGVKLFQQGDDDEVDPSHNPLVRLVRRFVPITDSFDGEHFFVRQNGAWAATPLFVVLVAIEASDVMFAVDSIPAIFAITKDPFLVYTSNIFAILGLRSLFFVVNAIIDKFYYLKVGLSLLLVYIGGKMLISDFYHVPPAVSLAIIGLFLGGAILASTVRSWRLKAAADAEAEASKTSA